MAEERRWDPVEREDEDEEEDLDETAYKSTKDAIIFAIEISPSMLAVPTALGSKKADTDSPAFAALKCAYALMQQRIISNPNDMMSILLYGTEKTKFQEDDYLRGGLSYPHCYLLTDLDIPAAEDVKTLKTLVEDEEEYKKLLVPSRELVSMANVLFCANQIFTTRAPNFLSRRLFVVTDDDNPHANSKTLKSAAAVRAKDLYDLGVFIELFPISKPNQDFDRAKFYDDIIYNVLPTDPETPARTAGPAKLSSLGNRISLLSALLSSINSRAVAKRALFSNLPFEIGPDLTISVKGYIIFKRQAPQRSCYIWVNGEKAQIAKSVTTQMADDTARTVEKEEIRKAYRFGGEQITFTLDEISTLRNFGDPVIRFIGFKPMSLLPIWASTRPSTFIYPSEEDFVGSTRVFSALQQKLLKDEKMGVAWFIARKNAAPVIAAIIPGAEKLNDDGEQLIPPGMWIVPLPFANDIRQNPETTLVRAPDSLINMMRTVIQQLQLPKAQYKPEKYANPALQWHYRILQALALEDELPGKPEDKTIPKYKQIDKRAGAYVLDWGIELESQYQAWAQENRGTATLAKRPAPVPLAKDGLQSDKKVHVADEGVLGDKEMRAHFDKKRIGKISVAALKAWMHTKRLPLGGKKQDLVDRVEGWFEKK